MIRHELERQGIAVVDYDGETQLMRIRFARGSLYEYEGVPPAIVTWLIRTKDPAGYVKRVITPRFAYRRVEEPLSPRPSARRNHPATIATDENLEAQLRASIDKLGGHPAS